ncbi:MAG: class F sortase [Actinobacteria bacterium]|nr:class F sortase [Actinomycetota bacterium]
MNRTVRNGTLIATLSAALLGLVGCGSGGSESVAPVAPATTSAAVAPASIQVGVPTRVEIPAIDVDEALHGVGLNPDGSMQTPDFGDAAWYDLGPRPGASGPAVVLAHVDSKGGPDVFYRLKDLEPGDRVTVHREDGASTFVVDSLEQVQKDALPYERIWADTDESVLRLITCGGSFDHSTGNYRDNIIVYAHLV